MMGNEVKEKEKVKKDVTPDLAKQLASVAFTVRKIKNWMEEKMGADLDGDGRVGSGPYNKVKKLGVLLAIAGLATVCSAAPYNTNNTVFVGPISAPVSYVDESGNLVVPNITVGAITASGLINGVTINTTMITNVITAGQVLPAVDGSAITNMSAAQLAAATVLLAVDGSAVTNIGAANIAAAGVLSAVDGSAVTNMAPATAFPDYGVVVVTNLDIDGTTNIITYIGTVSRNQ